MRVRLDVAGIAGALQRAAPALWSAWASTGAGVQFPAIDLPLRHEGDELGAVAISAALVGARGLARIDWRAQGRVGEQELDLVAIGPVRSDLLWRCPRVGCVTRRLYLPPHPATWIFASRQAHHLRGDEGDAD